MVVEVVVTRRHRRRFGGTGQLHSLPPRDAHTGNIS